MSNTNRGIFLFHIRLTYIAKAFLVLLLLCAYNYFLLRETDRIFSSRIIGYQSTKSYELAVFIFFIGASFFIFLALRYNWNKLFPFFSMSICIYLPLVSIHSLLQIHFGLPSGLYEVYQTNFCPQTQNQTLCGQALAHIVFSMSARALPSVLTSTPIFWVAMKYLKAHNPGEHLQDKNENH